MSNILDVKDLNINLNHHHLVKGASFSIGEGEIFAIVGESGSGKTITSLSLLQLLEYMGDFEVSGEAIFMGMKDLYKANKNEIRQTRGSEISIIFQDPMTSLNPLHKVGKQLKEAVLLHQKMPTKEINERINELFDLVGLSDQKHKLDSFPHEFSGGQRQRIMIVMALLNNPALLIADEPTTALDVTVQKEILAIFKRIKEKVGKSILLISHDLTVVRNIADRVAVMCDGEIVEQGTVKQIFFRPEHEYTKKLLSSEPKGEPHISKTKEKILNVNRLEIKYPIEKSIFGLNDKFFTAVHNAVFSLHNGQSIGIVGESGSGKSSIAKALLKLVQGEGEVLFHGNNILDMAEKDFKRLRKDIQIVFQDPYSSLNPRMMVKDIIKEGLEVHFPDLSKGEVDRQVLEVMDHMGLPKSFQTRYPHQLSGGQRQRVGIARSLILKPQILVLDEPTSALDLITQAEILNLLKALQSEENLSYLFISHDLRVIKSICDYILVVKNGTIVEEGNSNRIFGGARNEYTKNLVESSFFEGL